MTAMFPRRPASRPLPVGSGSPATAGADLFGPVTRLSALATDLTVRPLGPRPAFRDDLRARLMDEAGSSVTRLPHPAAAASPGDVGAAAGRIDRLSRRAAAAGLAILLAGGGVAAASDRALPGEPLYFIKRFGESVRIALDPTTSGADSALRVISTRITEVERTAVEDPGARNARRWRAVDSALRDADGALLRLTRSESSADLRTALLPDRTRLERLLPEVPPGQRAAVAALVARIDAIPAAPPETPELGALPFGLLPPGQLSTTSALADGWPMDLAPGASAPGLATPEGLSLGGLGAERPADGAGSPDTASTKSSSTTASGTGATNGGASGGATSNVLPRLPGSPTDSQPGTSRGTGTAASAPSGAGSAPRRTSSFGSTVDGATGGGLGGPVSTVPGTVDRVTGALGDATDSVSRLPLLNQSTSTRTPN